MNVVDFNDKSDANLKKIARELMIGSGGVPVKKIGLNGEEAEYFLRPVLMRDYDKMMAITTSLQKAALNWQALAGESIEVLSLDEQINKLDRLAQMQKEMDEISLDLFCLLLSRAHPSENKDTVREWVDMKP
jgi:hypothetical protein